MIEISDTRKKILDYAKTQKWFNPDKVAAALHISPRHARTMLARMYDAGEIVKEPSLFTGVIYKLPEPTWDEVWKELSSS